MKVCVLNYTGDRSNWGCQATSRSLIDFLARHLGGDAVAEIHTVPLPLQHRLDDLTTAAHGARVRGIFAKDAPEPDELAFLEGLARERFGDLAQRAADADLVIFQGEGSIGPRDYLGNARLFALPFLAAHLWRKPVVAMNMTLYASDPEDGPVLARLLSGFAAVAVREARSYSFAREIGLDRVLLCADMAFGASPGDEPTGEGPDNGGTFVVSGSAASEGYHPKRLLAAVRSVARDSGLTPVFISSRKADRVMFRRAAAALGDLHFRVLSSEDYPDFRQILPVLRQARFVLGGRYHTAVSALGEGTPVILLPGNTFKSEGLGPMLGLDLPVLRPDDAEGIADEARRILAGGADLRDRIADAVRSLRAGQDAFGAFLGRAAQTGDFDVPVPAGLRPEPAAFLAKGPYDAIYRASNPGRPGGASRIAGWQLGRLRRDPGFAASVRATIEKFGDR